MIRIVDQESLGTRSLAQPGNSVPGLRATETSVVDCRIASPMVR